MVHDSFKHKDFISPSEQIHVHRMDSGMYHSVTPHQHDFIELFYIRSGKAVHRLNNTTFKAGAGDIFIIQTGDTHAFEPITPDFEWIDILLLPAFVDFDVTSLLSNRKYYAKDGFEIDYLAQAILREFEEKKPSYLRKLQGYLLVLLGELERQKNNGDGAEPYAKRKQSRLLHEATSYIHIHYRDRIKLDDAAAALRISRSTLSRLFREQLDRSFIEYVNQFRLEQCAGQLRSSSRPIREVAFENGFGDMKQFRQLFRRRYGITPGEYRCPADTSY